MNVSITDSPQFDMAEDVRYEAATYRPLTIAQQRAVLAYAMYAQRHERMEVRWVDGKMVCQLVNTEDRTRV